MACSILGLISANIAKIVVFDRPDFCVASYGSYSFSLSSVQLFALNNLNFTCLIGWCIRSSGAAFDLTNLM
jgi:hypothetical protein